MMVQALIDNDIFNFWLELKMLPSYCFNLDDLKSLKKHQNNAAFNANLEYSSAVGSSAAIVTPFSRVATVDNLQLILNKRHRGKKRSIPDEQKDGKYFERRKRNNEAAKKSRDARKMREDRVSIFIFIYLHLTYILEKRVEN